MADGFLGRWAKRKEAVRKGELLPAEPVVVAPQVPAPPRPAGDAGNTAESPSPLVADGDGNSTAVAEPRPAPTLEDVESLTPASDFSRYVQGGVAPEVKNAAMKKLFADPHFNVMDRLDIYIDDYGKPDPMPKEWLRQLASAKFLGFFDDEEEKQKQKEGAAAAAHGKALTAREVADDPTPQTVAQSSTAEPNSPAVPPAEDHADPDLRLQQDDAPGPRGPGTRS